MKYCREKGPRGQFRIQALEERDSSEDASYWAKYSGVLPDKTERLWDALLDGLEKYRYITPVLDIQAVKFLFFPIFLDIPIFFLFFREIPIFSYFFKL